jgi:hypothetical protein
MRRISLFLVLMMFVLGVSNVASADPYRNIFLTSIDIVPYHGFEVGARFATFSADYLDGSLVAQGSFRYGLFHNVEVEALIPYYRFDPKEGSSINGVGKVSLGVTYSKIQTRFVEFGFYGGVLLPNSDGDTAFMESGANGLDLKFKGLISFPLSDTTNIQGNLGFIITGEGDTATQSGVNPDDILIYDVAFNHFVMDKKLKLIVELNGMNQDTISRLAVTPAVRWEIVPAFVVEGFASVALGDDKYRLYDTMFGIGFTYEFFTDRSDHKSR